MIRGAALAALLALGAAPRAEADPQRWLETPAHARLQAARAAAGGALTPFATDGCSGGLSAGWALVAQAAPGMAATVEGRPVWESCCVAHDRAYHRGGAEPSPAAGYAARMAADTGLQSCVATLGRGRADQIAAQAGVTRAQAETAFALLAQAMYAAVRLGGAPCTGLPWRWGYGTRPCWP